MKMNITKMIKMNMMKMMKIKVKMSMMMMKKVSHDDGYFVMKVILWNMSRDENNLVMKVMIVKELMTGDVSPVAMFYKKKASRRNHPLVQSRNQRLHASPTASNSRVGEEEKMSWNEIGSHHFSRGVTQDCLHNCNKGWGQSAKLGTHSAICSKLGTALQAYALNPCTKFPTSRKVNT